MKLTERVARLRTKTAFAVSAETAVHAAKGNKVYAFHIGDMNLRGQKGRDSARANALIRPAIPQFAPTENPGHFS